MQIGIGLKWRRRSQLIRFTCVRRRPASCAGSRQSASTRRAMDEEIAVDVGRGDGLRSRQFGAGTISDGSDGSGRLHEKRG